MGYGFPDWMFAAIAIAAYEIAAWVRHRFDLPWAMWVAYGIILICVVIVGIRYVLRMVQRRKEGESTDSDDWRDL
jgi:TRAP-type C4-dicarboxylate transport system permease small subunit